MSEPIEITRYPNRRLYDRSTGQYVTLQDLEQRIREGQDIVVRDSKTGDDLTRAILTQMLLERYPERMELFPVSLLHHMLRANDLAMEWMRNYLRQSLAFFESLPSGGAAEPPVASTPMPTSPPTPTPSPLPTDWFQSMLSPFLPPPPPPSAEASLAKRVEQLEQRLKELEEKP